MLDGLIRIVANGGGPVIDGSSMVTEDLVRIAANAAGKESHVVVGNVGARSIDELVRIASNGQGAVIFDFSE